MILYLIEDFGKDLFAEGLTLVVSRECRVAGFVDNKGIPDTYESLSYEFPGEFWIIHSQTLPSSSSSLPFSFVVWVIH